MIASLVCRVSRKVLLSAMVMDFGDCGVLTALSFNISDSLYSRRLLQKSHNLTSNPSSKIKKLHTIKVSSFVYSFGISFWFIDLICFPLLMCLLIYNQHWLYEIAEDYVLMVIRFMIHVLMEIDIVGIKFNNERMQL